MGNPFTEAVGKVLTEALGNVLTEMVGKVLDIYNFYEYNAYGPMIKLPGVPIEPGDLEVVFDFKATGKRKGTGTLSVNGKKAAEGEFYPAPWGWHEGLDIGRDRRGPVSWKVYKKHGPFPYTDTIYSVSYLPGPLAPDSIFHKSGE